MSSIMDRFQEPMFMVAAVIFIAGTIILNFLLDNWFVSGLVALLAAGAVYILYQDYKEKQRLEAAEAAKGADLQQRIKAQAEAESETGKCISCLAELPKGAEACPKCGFKVKHYSVDA